MYKRQKISLHQFTAAAGILDLVNTPAATVPGTNSASNTSFLLLYLILPDPEANDTPATFGRLGNVLGAKEETLFIPGHQLIKVIYKFNGMGAYRLEKGSYLFYI